MFRAGDDYGAGSLMICPNLNPAYLAPGTYAFSVTGLIFFFFFFFYYYYHYYYYYAFQSSLYSNPFPPKIGSLRAENTEMSVTVFLQEERYPIAPPEDRYSCDDFPVEV